MNQSIQEQIDSRRFRKPKLELTKEIIDVHFNEYYPMNCNSVRKWTNNLVLSFRKLIGQHLSLERCLYHLEEGMTYMNGMNAREVMKSELQKEGILDEPETFLQKVKFLLKLTEVKSL